MWLEPFVTRNLYAKYELNMTKSTYNFWVLVGSCLVLLGSGRVSFDSGRFCSVPVLVSTILEFQDPQFETDILRPSNFNYENFNALICYIIHLVESRLESTVVPAEPTAIEDSAVINQFYINHEWFCQVLLQNSK